MDFKWGGVGKCFLATLAHRSDGRLSIGRPSVGFIRSECLSAGRLSVGRLSDELLSVGRLSDGCLSVSRLSAIRRSAGCPIVGRLPGKLPDFDAVLSREGSNHSDG